MDLPSLLFCVIVGGLGGVHLNAHQEVRAFMTDPVLQQRLAKYLVLECFRNSTLEDFHAGISPSSASGDCSDVTVISPYGAVPWPKVSRLNDDEMKRLMIDVVDRTCRFIHTLFDENTGGELLLRLAYRDPLPVERAQAPGRRRIKTGHGLTTSEHGWETLPCY
jgi:hypothetical protein